MTKIKTLEELNEIVRIQSELWFKHNEVSKLDREQIEEMALNLKSINETVNAQSTVITGLLKTVEQLAHMILSVEKE